MLLDASPTASKCAAGKVRAGWVEAEEFVEDDLELSFSKRRLHAFDAVDVWQAGNVVKERWRGPAADFLVDLEGGSVAELPGSEHKGGGNDTEVLEGFDEERAGHWGAPRVVPCISSGRVLKRGYEVGGLGAFPEKFPVRAVGEAST